MSLPRKPESGGRARAAALVAAFAIVVAAAAALWHAGRGGPADRAPGAMPVEASGPESCVACHGAPAGLSGPHAPVAIGCAACHEGDPRAADRAGAHAGMVPIPGNLADAARTCGRAGCHAEIVPRVERSIMTTMAGVVAADRRVVDGPAAPGSEPPRASDLGDGAADSHLRELCVSCHLGQAKSEAGPITQESRGGGCNACHLVYDAAARAAHERFRAAPATSREARLPAHPSLTVNPANDHCFGCHSRSSRIATSYEGWHEVHEGAAAAKRRSADPARLRTLEDGRLFERVVPDVHHERGLDCIDCHTANEAMGAGAIVARQRDQLRVGCEDCHARRLPTVAPEAMTRESRVLLALRGRTLGPTERIGATRGGEPLVNVVVDADGTARLVAKRSGAVHPLRPPATACTEGGGHARLACAACHTAWAPRCPTCHTRFDPGGEGFDHLAQRWRRGEWIESAGPFAAAPPTLGVRGATNADGSAREVVATFVPGMILTFDRNRTAGGAPDVVFRRLYGPISAHTIRREARSCASCHADSEALGYGRGRLRYETGGGAGRWRFRPQSKPSPFDGLPEDAWIGFLAPRDGMVAAHDGARPFTADEQRRVLTVGACLACHEGGGATMARAVADFAGALARRSAKCAVPAW